MNFQNIPPEVTGVFLPKLGSFNFFDYKRIEPTLLAYYLSVGVHDDTLREALIAGKDLYREIVGPMLGKKPDELDEKEYKRGKIQFLSLMYGGGVKTIQEQFGLTRKEAASVVYGFKEAWPSIVELGDRLNNTASRRGYIKTPWGRHLHREQYGEHKLLNKLIQGSAADLMKASLVKIDRWLAAPDPPIGPPESHMVSVIHDEIIFDGPESEAKLLHHAIPSLMDDERISAVVPIGVDHEISTTSWAEKIEYEEWLSLQERRASKTPALS